MATPESRVGTHHAEKKHNLKFLGPALASVLLLTLLASACAPKAESTASTTVWRDASLLNNPDHGLTSMMIELDFLHDPAGSLGVRASFNDAGEVIRIASEEKSPNRGNLVDKIIKLENKDWSGWPVSPVDPKDEVTVYVANSSTNDGKLSNPMGYEIIRIGNELKIKNVGRKLIPPPGFLKMRDAQVSPEAQLQQEISTYLQQQENMTAVPWDSKLVGGTWASPKEPVTPVSANGRLEISAIPTSELPIQYVVITANYRGRKSPDPKNPDAWAILGIVDKPDINKNGVWSLPPFDVASLGLNSKDIITLSFDVVARDPVTGKLERKLAPNGTHMLAITN